MEFPKVPKGCSVAINQPHLQRSTYSGEPVIASISNYEYRLPDSRGSWNTWHRSHEASIRPERVEVAIPACQPCSTRRDRVQMQPENTHNGFGLFRRVIDERDRRCRLTWDDPYFLGLVLSSAVAQSEPNPRGIGI